MTDTAVNDDTGPIRRGRDARAAKRRNRVRTWLPELERKIPWVDLLSEEQVRTIHEASMDIIEEVGVDPCANDGGRGYRRRIASLIAAGRAWARFEDGQVGYKAEIGSQSATVGQIQGVWVHPLYRGRGLGSSGTAAVVDAVVRSGRTASLYVNSYNLAARRAYARIGLTQVATFTTVLLD